MFASTSEITKGLDEPRTTSPSKTTTVSGGSVSRWIEPGSFGPRKKKATPASSAMSTRPVIAIGIIDRSGARGVTWVGSRLISERGAASGDVLVGGEQP